jgi:hypothetical protein
MRRQQQSTPRGAEISVAEGKLVKIRKQNRLLLPALALVLACAPLAEAQNRRTVESGPPPRTADGKIILGSLPGQMGMWSGFGTRPMLTVFDVIPEGSIIAYTPFEDVLRIPDRFPKIPLSEVPFQPWAKALFEARSRTRFEPYTRCKPSAGPRAVATAYGTQFVEFPDMQKIYIFPTGGPRHFREIWMDGRDHPDDFKPGYHGHSIGYWEGDTLVVDTVGYNEKMWFDAEGSPHTNQLHLTERFTRVSTHRLDYEVTIDDPGAYTRPWTSGYNMSWEDGESFEFVCQDQNEAFELMLGTEYEAMDRSQPIFP